MADLLSEAIPRLSYTHPANVIGPDKYNGPVVYDCCPAQYPPPLMSYVLMDAPYFVAAPWIDNVALLYPWTYTPQLLGTPLSTLPAVRPVMVGFADDGVVTLIVLDTADPTLLPLLRVCKETVADLLQVLVITVSQSIGTVNDFTVSPEAKLTVLLLPPKVIVAVWVNDELEGETVISKLLPAATDDEDKVKLDALGIVGNAHVCDTLPPVSALPPAVENDPPTLIDREPSASCRTSPVQRASSTTLLLRVSMYRL